MIVGLVSSFSLTIGFYLSLVYTPTPTHTYTFLCVYWLEYGENSCFIYFVMCIYITFDKLINISIYMPVIILGF